MKSFVKQYQISIFFAVTLIIGWFPWYTGRGSIIYAAPFLAAFIVAFLADGRKGVLNILRRLGRWRANWLWYVFILFSPAVIYGSVQRDKGGDVFVHYNEIRGDGYRSLFEGQRVEFSVIEGMKGPQAQEVSVIDV